MKKVFNLRPLPVLFAALAGASVLFLYLPLAALCVCLLLTAFALAAFFIKKMTAALRQAAVLLAVGFLLGTVCSSAYLLQVENRKFYAESVEIVGVISIKSETDREGNLIDGGTVYLRNVTADGKKLQGLTEVQGEIYGVSVGDVVRFSGGIGSVAQTPRSTLFNAADIVSRKFYTANVQGHFTRTSAAPNFAERIQLGALSILSQNMREDAAAFGYAMLFGDRSFVSYDIKADFNWTGLAHIFAVSGLHVGALAAFLLFVFKKARLPMWLQWLLLFAVLGFYASLVGFSSSVARAGIMLMVMMTAKMLGLKNDLPASAALAAALIVMVRPVSVFDIGFQMSFLAVVGILLFLKPLSALFVKIMPAKIASVFAVSLAANIGLAPVLLSYFGSMSLLFLPANFLVVPVISILFPVMLLFVCVTAMLPFLGIFLSLIGWVLSGIVWLCRLIAHIPFPFIAFEMTWYFSLTYFVLLLFVSRYSLLGKRKKQAIAVLMSVLVGVNAGMSLQEIIVPKGTVTVYAGFYHSETSLILIKNRAVGNVLIIEGEPDRYDFYETKRRMRALYIGQIDVVVCRTVRAETAVLLYDFQKELGFAKIVAESVARRYQTFEYYDDFVSKNFRVYFGNAGETLIKDGTLDWAVIPADVRLPAEDLLRFDLILSAQKDGVKEALVPVIDLGALDASFTGGGFTFRIKNDKISKTQNLAVS